MRLPRYGFTLVELLLGGMALSLAIAAILGSYIGQVTLNEHARNLSLAIQDANRVIEELRHQNNPCLDAISPITPSVLPPPLVPPPGNFASWDAWLAADTADGGGGGKSIQSDELLVLTAQNRDGTTPLAADADPIRLIAAVCWRHRNRTMGECSWDGVTLAPDESVSMPSDTINAIDSPAMLTTLVTCR